MHQNNTVIAGLSKAVLLGALVAGAAAPNAGAGDVSAQVPIHTAVFNGTQGQSAPTETVGAVPSVGSQVPPVTGANGCTEIVVGATELIFTDPFETGDTGAWAPDSPARFSAVRMLDLNLTVRFAEGFIGDHVLHLKIFTPKGHHYQTLSVPISSDPQRRGSLRRVEGYPRPLSVLLLHEGVSSSLPEVMLSVPVGGTPIVANSIFGTWTAEATLDDHREVCASQPFVLNP